MNLLMKTLLLASLTILLNGCLSNFNFTNNSAPKPNLAIQKVESSSIKSISDITSIALEWKKVSDYNVEGYNIYRSDLQKDGNSLTLIKKINNRYTTHFVDKKLQPNTLYIYQITSRAKDGSESTSTTAYKTKTLPRLEAVSFLQAISNLPHQIKISWRPHSSQKVGYYEVQRFNKNSKNKNGWNTIATIGNGLRAEYIDADLGNSQSEKYRIVAFTYDKVASQPSKAVTAISKPLPLPPQMLKATLDLPKKIKLTWEASPTKDVIKYTIFRSCFESFGYLKKGEISANSELFFNDLINENNEDYYYKVYSVDKDGLVSDENATNNVRGITLPAPRKPILTLGQIQGDKAILNWMPGDNRTETYNIYKTIKTDFWNSKTVKYTGIKSLRFEDRDITHGIEYKYCIQAVDKFGIVSDKTDETILILPKPFTGN